MSNHASGQVNRAYGWHSQHVLADAGRRARKKQQARRDAEAEREVSGGD
jgi:hypothetical protein